MVLRILFALSALVLIAEIDCQAVDGAAAGSRPHQLSQARVFDLPKFAPTARIIKLSRSFRGKHRRREDDLLSDAAGSFDNFDAFDLENLEPSSGESKPTRKQQNPTRKAKTNDEKDIGNFFPERN
ncbi:hypothetical protein OESDEN_05081 [Oesophagostomum dentatum]|uniref:Uncharacterized protein n=1 Tax=Oesophagostomum dentatum TaxID=61180 RepID=A0A0B1TCG9_OESDE|nr:hypothetical protein OESDEN_05081 [Oesophagostomum dentatum]